MTAEASKESLVLTNFKVHQNIDESVTVLWSIDVIRESILQRKVSSSTERTNKGTFAVKLLLSRPLG